MDASELKQLEELAPKHPELQAQWENHISLSKQLDKIQTKSFFTPEDELAMKELKKQKLEAKTSLLHMLETLS